MTRGPLKPEVVSEKQRFVDDPVYREVSKAKPLALAVNAAALAMSGGNGPSIRASIHEISHHERVLLRWMKPDGKGGLVPKYP